METKNNQEIEIIVTIACPKCKSENVRIEDDSFEHEFGTEIIKYPVCNECDYQDDDWGLDR